MSLAVHSTSTEPAVQDRPGDGVVAIFPRRCRSKDDLGALFNASPTLGVAPLHADITSASGQ